MVPGLVTIVAKVTDGIRMRCFVTPPPYKRRDTDRNCGQLLPGYAKAELTRLRTLAAGSGSA